MKQGAQPGNKNAYNPNAKTRHPLYETWRGMRQRCYNPKRTSFHRYGGRGIYVCAAWDDFWGFVFDMGEKPVGHTLDRIDNDWHYTPNNCRWVIGKTQYRNHRKDELGRWIEA